MQTWQKAAGIAGLVTAVYAAGTTLNAPLPRPAWATDIERLAGEIASTKRLTLQQAVESADLRRIRIKGEIEQRRAAGEPVPEWLLQEERKLDRRIREFESELEDLR